VDVFIQPKAHPKLIGAYAKQHGLAFTQNALRNIEKAGGMPKTHGRLYNMSLLTGGPNYAKSFAEAHMAWDENTALNPYHLRSYKE
jgi:hypothetical protein